MDQEKPASKLKIVATPIGNLKDITLRALEELKNADVVLSEDTRETYKIIKHFGLVVKNNISYRDQNHQRLYPQIVAFLKAGLNVILVSDSGTPLISDPGYKLVRDLINDGYFIEVIPGPSAIIASLVVSGLPTDKFVFIGFLPKTTGDRKRIIKEYGNLESSLVIYESPFRILKLLDEIKNVLGNRHLCIINDITKMYEKIWRDSVENLQISLKNYKLKGEFVVIIAKEGFK